MPSFSAIARHWLLATGMVVSLLSVLSGCGGEESLPDAAPAPGSGASAADVDIPDGQPQPSPPPRPWIEPLESAVDHLDHARLDEADKQLQAAETLLADAGDGDDTAADTGRLESLKKQLASAREAEVDRLAEEKSRKRAERLTEAKELQESGKLDEATAALDSVLSMAPTTQQRETVRELKDAIETHRAARRRLGSWMKMLASKQRSEVRAAQNQLRRDPDTAIPLLLEAVRSQDRPLLVRNTLEMLRRLRRPDVAVPAMIGVLSRADQQASWPDAVREISQLKVPGAGPLLLPLLLKSDSAAQKTAVLAALAKVPDPPADTLTALLRLLHADGSELEPALRAAFTAMSRHGQDDLVALRGLPAGIDDATADLLAKLPERLTQVAARKGDEHAAAAAAARMLAVLVGVSEPAVLQGVKVAAAVGQLEDSSASAVIDGKWDAEDLKTGWRHSLAKPGTIILDLGSEKTVAAVRVWNYNGGGQRDRGWKEVEVFVSNSRTDLTPEASGVIPRAPGANDTPDFSIQLPVDQVRGRYVILKAKSLWAPSNFAGLSEVQVIGY